MNRDQILAKWDEKVRKSIVEYCPEETMRRESENITWLVVPGRAKRFHKGGCTFCPIDPAELICTYDRLSLLVNKYPIFPQHMLLTSNEHQPQNAFHPQLMADLCDIVEQTGFRIYTNMVGAGASLPHFHANVQAQRFNIEQQDEFYGFSQRFTGPERLNLYAQAVQSLPGSFPSTIDKNGNDTGQVLYNTLLWPSTIMLIPRKKEKPANGQNMIGGSEMGGTFTSVDDPGEEFYNIAVEQLYDVLHESQA